MAQLSKLYNFYFRNIFKKNWLRLTIVSTFIVGILWFLLPYGIFLSDRRTLTLDVEEELSNPNIPVERRRLLENVKEVVKNYDLTTFHGWNQFMLAEAGEFYFKSMDEELEAKKKQLQEQIKAGASEEDLAKISKEIKKIEVRKNQLKGVTIFTDNNAFFFNNTDGYNKGKDFWKLLNNISLWNLGGFVVSFFLIYNILDKTFISSEKDGEEAMVITFTPGVKRSDLFWSKILAFLTFYVIINFLTFLLPYGIYYFWIAPQKSLGAFSMLSLYSLVIGPILFFGLYFATYIFSASTSKFLGTIFFSLVSFFPMIWAIIKAIFSTSFWPYTVEKYFFDPAVFTTLSLVSGTVFLFLYYWNYQEKDLN